MKHINKLSILLILCVIVGSKNLKAQDWEFGGGIGPMFYHGDLAKPFIQVQATKLYVGALAIYNINSRFAAKLEVCGGRVAGNDKYAPNTPEGRELKQRNLNFYSNIMEVSTSIEINFLKFKPWQQKKRFTPFLSAGIGIFHFDPRTTYNGNEIRLQPLATELNKPKYNLTQPCFPIGGGLKFSTNNYWIFSISYITRFLLTDYLDDVSHNWQTNATPGSLGNELTYRGDEANYGDPILVNHQNPNDPLTTNRGNPKLKDNYMMLSFAVAKRLHKFTCGGF